MVQQAFESCMSAYVHHLKRCIRSKALSDGKQVHAHMVIHSTVCNVILENTLIDMYAKCGTVQDARRVFDRILLPNLFSWTAIITAYSQQKQFQEVVDLFQHMQCTGIVSDRVLFMLVINACTNLASLHIGELVHAHVIRCGYESDASVGKNLIEMYKRCGMIHDAREVFDKIRSQDVILWTAMISGYVQHALCREALGLFEQMESEGVEPNEVTLVSVINACAGLAASEHGMHIHSWVMQDSFDSNALIANSLMDMYVKCGCLKNACSVFDKMCDRRRDVISWTTMIAGHAQGGYSNEALAFFDQMDWEGVKANHVTYTSALKACTGMVSSKWGMHVHAHIIRSGLHMDVSTQNSLIDMYTKCGSIKDARCMFDNILEPNIVTWTAMITGYVEHGVGEEALNLFRQMQTEGVKVDGIILVSILKACTTLAALHLGKQFHAQIVKSGLLTEIHVGSALIDMYAKCGSMDNATEVFRKLDEPDVVSWTAMITGYSERGLGKEALAIFEEMGSTFVQANSVTHVNILKVCADLMNVERGKQVHGQIVRFGLDLDGFIPSGLVDLYAKCRRIEDARCVFDSMRKLDQVSWNALIAGYIQAGLFQDAFVLYEKMQCMGLQPDTITSVAILRACMELASLENGKRVHGCIIERGFEWDVFVSSTLIDMYAKCGTIDDARIVFNKMKSPDLVSWNAILGGCAQQGHSKETLELFEQMQHSLVNPDIVTFGCVLAACSHGGLLDKGQHYFNVMTQDFGMTPLPWHCACIVDLLGRAGHLGKAEEFINKLPIQPDVVVWMTLLGACRNHGNIALGRCAFNNVMKLDLKNAAAYVLLSNIYAAAGRWDKAASVRKEMEAAGLKNPECTWIEGNGVQHYFLTGEFSRLSDGFG